MKRLLVVSLFLCCCLILPGFTQEAEPKPPVDPYKPTLDRLQSLTTMELPEWRFHADVPHPEDPNLNDTDWPTVKVHEEWETAPVSCAA